MLERRTAALRVGIAALDAHTLWHWEGLLRASSDRCCEVVERRIYNDPQPARQADGLARPPAIWLIDARAPHLLSPVALGWLRGLAAPALVLCAQHTALRRLAALPCTTMIGHPQTLARWEKLPALLALLAGGTVTAGPLHLGIEPPRAAAPGPTRRRLS
jgi:hypothetical protein